MDKILVVSAQLAWFLPTIVIYANEPLAKLKHEPSNLSNVLELPADFVAKVVARRRTHMRFRGERGRTMSRFGSHSISWTPTFKLIFSTMISGNSRRKDSTCGLQGYNCCLRAIRVHL
jgi:hypothetical protein